MFSALRFPKRDKNFWKRSVRRCYELVRNGAEKKVAEDMADLKTRLAVTRVEEKGLRDWLEELRRAKEQWEERERLAREELQREKERWEVREQEMQSRFAERERKLRDDKYQLQRQLQYLEARWNDSDQLHVNRSATRAAHWQATLDDDITTDHQTLPLGSLPSRPVNH